MLSIRLITKFYCPVYTCLELDTLPSHGLLHISDRSSSINIYNYLSSHSPMKYGVPQESILLGPSLFSIYLYPLPSIISKYPNIYFLLYADDIQLGLGHLYMFLPTNLSPGLNNQLSIMLMTLNNGLFLIIFSLIPPKLHCSIFLQHQFTSILFLLITL